MATYLSAAYKNAIVDTITGRAATSLSYVQPRFVIPYAGAQQPDPTLALTGTLPFAAVSSFALGASMSAASVGVSTLGTPKSATPSTTVASLANIRIYNQNQVGIIDTTVSLSGGGGGAILDSLTATIGTPLSVTAFSFKMPQVLGAVMMNIALVDAIANAMNVTAATIGLCTSSVTNVYSGTPPASADLAATGTLLVSFTNGVTSPWAAAAGGASALTAALASSAAVATGTATYARIVKGTYVLQGTVGTSAANFILDTVAITSGSTINLTEATISV